MALLQRPDPAGCRYQKESMDLTKLLTEKYGNKNESDMVNRNIGSPGTNVTYDQAQGNRGKQLNTNRLPDEPKPGAPDDEDYDGEVYGPVGDD